MEGLSDLRHLLSDRDSARGPGPESFLSHWPSEAGVGRGGSEVGPSGQREGGRTLQVGRQHEQSLRARLRTLRQRHAVRKTGNGTR